jgi:hypothetical protein
MQVVGRFTVTGLVGSCDVGEVWSAVDAAGQPVTVAVLTGAAAQDQPWRDAFAATTYTLSGAGDGLPIVDADHTATEPWAACADEPGSGAAQIFMALGMQITPATQPAAETRPTSPSTPAQTATATQAPLGETAPVAQAAAPASASAAEPASPETPVASPSTSVTYPAFAAAAERATAEPILGQESKTQPPPQVNNGPADPTAPPTSLELARQDTMWLRTQQPVSGVPMVPYTGDTTSAAPPARRRIGLWVAVAAIVALALGTAGGALGTSLVNKGDDPVVDASPTEHLDLGLPSAAPSRPGVEPPRTGSWPDWPKFQPADPATTMNLSGVGFTFRVPVDWDCVQVARGSGFAHYTCGHLPEIGGDVIVRQCPSPCTDDRRIEMRTTEEAWGLRWIRSGRFVSFAATQQVDGAPRYGLVYVGYWRSVPEGPIDRQIVFRMTSPLEQADQVRKVINGIHSTTFTS